MCHQEATVEMTEVFPGYQVEKLSDDPLGYAYQITGPRKTWMLIRNRPNPTMMFVVTDRGAPGKVRGYEWFTDKDGTLRAVR